MPAPHGYRCAVRELRADAQALCTWRSARIGYEPKAGDLLVSSRPGGLHVERVSIAHARRPTTIGANERNTWIESADVDLLGSTYLGAIDYPAALGAAALVFARNELAGQVVEWPGPKANPRISAYHARARRGGSPWAGMPGRESEGLSTLGANASDEIPWCASGASWCCWIALR